jgi:hypothetical protein
VTGSAIVLAADAQIVIDRCRAQASKIGSIVEVHKLETPEDEATAGELLRVIATLSGELETARKKEKAPHLEAGKKVDAAFRDAGADLTRVDGMLRSRLQEAIQDREAKRLANLRTAALEAQAGNQTAANAALATIPQDVTVSGIAERWTWEPVSVRLCDVPEMFLMLDLTKVRAYVKDCDGAEPKISGITFERKANLSVRKL